MSNGHEYINYASPDTLFSARNHDVLYGQMDEETLNQLVIDAYERLEECEKIINDIEAEKVRRNETKRK